jgi:1-acyl-sn-glycerol-3-phosphate acyltransferase
VGCIPVDRDQRPERALREALRVLAQGQVIALFPHGRIHLDDDPPRRLKSGVAKLAQLARVPIVPMRLDGVRGQRQTLLAVFRRSRARLRSYAPLDCTEGDAEPPPG